MAAAANEAINASTSTDIPTTLSDIPHPERQLPLDFTPEVLARLERELPQPKPAAEEDGRMEEALDSDQVIELQTFIDRKAWIEEKIQLLEKMPPVEVFVGLEALRTSAEYVPGLPTRSELKMWIVEHDTVEKETEIFDSGELTKLRKFTKAATQRHLSPEDTDLIELTLTTIYELDKLLHLLRDRSENLDLLGVRIQWEEARISAWRDRRQILADVKTFLETHARWSPSVYDSLDIPDDTIHRRGSVASMASDTSSASSKFSRAIRFKLAERLSRDAAQISARISALRHGKATTAGKALDKLIDMSRRPVPDELLDEQDRVEEKCISELEDLGDFVMEVITQWRKADEIYVETIKDSTTAQTLIEELETASLQHPVARLSTLYCSRADALLKRLKLRGNPASPTSGFPSPLHPLVEEQRFANEAVVQTLSAELAKALNFAKKADFLAKEYRDAHEAVTQVEELLNTSSKLAASLNDFIHKLSVGVVTDDGDGSPPDLSSRLCLDAHRHAPFLALLPSITREYDVLCADIDHLMGNVPASLRRLERPGISSSFKSSSLETFDNLTKLVHQSRNLHDDVTARVTRLRQSRNIWTAITDIGGRLLGAKQALDVELDSKRWRKDTQNDNALSTPESAANEPLSSTDTTPILETLNDISSAIMQRVQLPLERLVPVLEAPIQLWLADHLDSLSKWAASLQQSTSLLDTLASQKHVMTTLRDECHSFQIDVENKRLEVEAEARSVLESRPEKQRGKEMFTSLSQNVVELRQRIEGFTNTLADRIPLVAQGTTSKPIRHLRRKSSISEFNIGLDAEKSYLLDPELRTQLPFDLNVVDSAVRLECNSMAMLLANTVQELDRALAYFQQALLAAEVDGAIDNIAKDLQHSAEVIKSLRASLSNLPDSDRISFLLSLRDEADNAAKENRTRLTRSLSFTRQLVEQLDQPRDIGYSHAGRPSLHANRDRAIKDVHGHYQELELETTALLDALSLAIEREHQRLESIQRELEAARIQQERAAAEEAERQRQEEQHRLDAERREQERLAAEEEAKRRQEEEQLREAARLEQERRVAEEAERLRLAEENLAADRARFEQERLATEEASRLAAEAGRIATENILLEQERALAERKLAEEERAAVERERKAFQEQIEAERLAAKSMSPQILIEPLASGSDFEEDVFGFFPVTDDTKPLPDIKSRILALRKQLLSLGIHEIARPPPSSASAAVLPTRDQASRMSSAFMTIQDEANFLPASVSDVSTDTELRSLRSECETTLDLVNHVVRLTEFAELIQACDGALSDLLEHIDSYPHPPLLSLSVSLNGPRLSPEKELEKTINSVKRALDDMDEKAKTMSEDPRVRSEQDRVSQTWSELKEMADERMTGRSRPPSSASVGPSSGRESRSSIANRLNTRRGSVQNNSFAGPSKGRFLAPSAPTRRVVSGSSGPPTRPSSQMSTMSTRSTSGTFASSQGSTFSSRQRTKSAAPSPSVTPRAPAPRPHQSSTSFRRTLTSSTSSTQSFNPLSRSVGPMPRTPRHSLSSSVSSLPRNTTPVKKTTTRKPYVANPKNKLDVAVGSVVNNLPVSINVEVVKDTWKDKSGKYWIGDQDPKLCFCRILRSQTVMVRVGGGWSELSKFIKDHFADAFRILPESPPRGPMHEEKWISSATLLEAADRRQTPPRPPRTPEPRHSFPSPFSFSPGAESTHSVQSTPSKGSPLTPLQFMRRADPSAPALPSMARPGTPSKTPTLRSRRSGVLISSTRSNIWRP